MDSCVPVPTSNRIKSIKTELKLISEKYPIVTKEMLEEIVNHHDLYGDLDMSVLNKRIVFGLDSSVLSPHPASDFIAHGNNGLVDKMMMCNLSKVGVNFFVPKKVYDKTFDQKGGMIPGKSKDAVLSLMLKAYLSVLEIAIIYCSNRGTPIVTLIIDEVNACCQSNDDSIVIEFKGRC